MIIQLPFSHESSSINVELVGVFNKEMGSFLYFELAFLKKIDMGWIRTLLVYIVPLSSIFNCQKFNNSFKQLIRNLNIAIFTLEKQGCFLNNPKLVYIFLTKQ